MTADIRWKQRFENFDRMATLLEEACSAGVDTLSALEKEGAIHRFQRCFELAWKTLRDYMEANGLEISPVTPRNVVKEAFAADILDDGQIWIDMMLHRNLLAHRYDEASFEMVLKEVEARYLAALLAVRDFFRQRIVQP